MRSTYASTTARPNIYQGECRFTERSLEVKTHGHGIKLSIRNSPVKGDVVSLFLDAGELDNLREALEVSTPQASRTKQLERVLIDMSDVLHRNGF